MRKEFVYSFMALGAIPVTVNAADVQATQISTDVLASTDGKLTLDKVTLAPGKYTFKGSLTSKTYGVKVLVDGEELETIADALTAQEVAVVIDLSKKTADTEIQISLESTDPSASGADFTLGAPSLDLTFDFDDAKDKLTANANNLKTVNIAAYAYTSTDDEKAVDAIVTKIGKIEPTYADYTANKLYDLENSPIQAEIDELAATIADHQNTQAYNDVNDAIMAIKAQYNAAVTTMENTLTGVAAYLLDGAKAELKSQINDKITAATQASYKSYSGKTAVADKATNIAAIPTEEALEEILTKYTGETGLYTQAKTNIDAYNALHKIVTDLQALLDAIEPNKAIASQFTTETEEAQAAIDAVNEKVEAAKNSAAQLTLGVKEEEAAAKTKINTLAGKVTTANAEYTAWQAALKTIGTLQTDLDEANEAVNAAVSTDKAYKAQDYYADYVGAEKGIQKEIDDFTTAANKAYNEDKNAVDYNDDLDITTTQTKIATYKEKAIEAVEKYDALQEAIESYQKDLDAAVAEVENLDIYKADGYDYETKFNGIQKKINNITKAIDDAKELKGAEHWTAMLDIDANAAITDEIANQLASVQADQNQFDATELGTAMTTLSEKITAFKAKDVSKLGADVANYQAIETGIETAYDAVDKAKTAIATNPATVDYTANVTTDAAAWGGSACPGDNTFAETYGTADEVAKTGTLMSQTFNVENGTYTVVINANANFTSGRGFDSDLVDGAEDVAYVFANDKTEEVIAHVDGGMDGEYTISDVIVTDGKLKIGIAKAKAGTNWHTIKIKSLTATTASLINGWGTKVADLDKQQTALETAASAVEAKVTANGKAQTTLASSIVKLQEQIETFTSTYKIGDDEKTTLGLKGKADGSITKELGEINTALGELKTANDDVDPTAVTKAKKTDKVGSASANWNGASGLAGTWAAPAVSPDDERGECQMVEKYMGSDVETIGDILTQTITGLDNGVYEVTLYANSYAANEEATNKANSIKGDANDVAYVFANDVKQFITAKVQTSTPITNGEYTLENVIVSDGTLKLGLAKEKEGTNWHTIQIKSLTFHENDLLSTYNNTDEENLGLNNQYTALAQQESALETTAAAVKTAVDAQNTAKDKADEALTGLNTYLNNLKSLADVTGDDGTYNGSQTKNNNTSNNVAKKSDPSNWYVFKTGLEDDQTYETKKTAIDKNIAALTQAIADAYATESLPTPWNDQITVVTEDDPATADVNEASSTTYKISEIKAAVDALKKEAADESANYWAYRNVNNNDMGKLLPDTITTEESVMGAGAKAYYQGLKEQYITNKADILTRMQASLNARTAVADKAGYQSEITALINKVKAVYTDSKANYEKYQEQTKAAAEAQTLWNQVYTEIAATDQSTTAQAYLDELDEIQVTLTAALAAVEKSYPEGKSVAEAKDFAAIKASINDVKARQNEGYSAQITADNKAAHETFAGNETTKGTIQMAQEAYDNAVKVRAEYSSTNADIKAAVDAAAAEFDKVLNSCPDDIKKLSAEEEEAYLAAVSPTVFVVDDFNKQATQIQSDITKAQNDFTDAVGTAIQEFWEGKNYAAQLETAQDELKQALTDAGMDEKDIDDEFLNAAFADVVELITAGNDAATNMSLAGVEEVITALDGIADMLSADKEAAAKADIDELIQAVDEAYAEVMKYIGTVDDGVAGKSDIQEELEKAYTEDVVDAKEQDMTFENYVAIATELREFLSSVENGQTDLENAAKAFEANATAYAEMTEKYDVLAAKLADAKDKAAGYKYETSFGTDETNLAELKATIDEKFASGEAVVYLDVDNGQFKTDSTAVSNGIEKTLTTAHGTEKTGLAADITELWKQYYAFVAANSTDAAADYKTAIEKLNDELTAAEIKDLAITEEKPEGDGIDYADIVAATEALIEIQNKIADKQSELLEANNSQANTEVLASFTDQIGDLKDAATLEGKDEWVGQQAYVNTTLGEAIADLQAQIAEVETAIQAEDNISFFKDKYQAQITAIEEALKPVVKAITALQEQCEANAEAYAELTAELDRLQGLVDDAKKHVSDRNYEYAADTYFNLIERYDNDGNLYSGAQYEINQAKDEVDDANDNKDAQNYDLNTNVETTVQSYLNQSAYRELSRQGSALATALTNAIAVDENEYSNAMWQALVAKKNAIDSEITELRQSIYQSNAAYEGSFDAVTNLSTNINGVGRYYYTLDENNQRISKDVTIDVDYDEQIKIVNELKDAIANFAAEVEANKLGDISGDGSINTFDYTQIIDMVVGNQEMPEPGTPAFEAADINGDGAINVIDATQLVNIILYNNPSGAVAGARGMDTYLTVNDKVSTMQLDNSGEHLTFTQVAAQGNTKRLALAIDNIYEYTNMQMDIVLPEGMKIVGTSLAERSAANHELAMGNIGGATRLLMMSAGNSVIAGQTGAVVYIDVQTDSRYAGGEVMLGSVIFTDAQGNYSLFGLNGEATGINSVESDTLTGKIYNLGGKIMNGLKKGINIIRRNDGSTEKVVVK